ncbi:translation initiation factor eIF-2B subunit beta [Athalia rosae]|uniref:translation initiation factor eIF-2B subunit beta n=1 Tax=Athalia rosae TaxID=37344 RepID=UPI0006251020|nr:translation initiation factor eIF-2B subunit beta [Athalia rosae]XP_048509425.1 translation initiation factor eIF-2B subunit beta [Athalia rosae]XP_048509426.1 translation initiation factor eIF-2B subunit beta [Athalia rosae]
MVADNPDEIDPAVLALIKDINYGKIHGSYNIVVSTVLLLKKLITSSKWNTAEQVMELIRKNGKVLIDSIPLEASIGNMIRRILKIIREEYISELKNRTDETDPQESLHKIITAEGDQENDFSHSLPSLKSALIEHITEFEVELETCSGNITQQASKHIHSNEIIMTLGKSRLVEDFLKQAVSSRTFEVIVAEGGPFLNGHEMAANLAKASIKTTLISDVAIFAMMSRVNKVIIGTHTVMANGGLRSITGSHTVAQAAKHYSVPVMVLLPLYKLSPLYLCSYEQDAFNKHVSPTQGVIDGTNAPLMEKIQAYNPVFDYVPPELVTLFITNTGGNAPSYIYRLLSELYHPDDFEL